MARESNEIFNPELIRILKVFGITSILIVFSLSFFNEKKADNSGELKDFRVTDASRIYFRNLRKIYYDVENKADAKLEVYRHSKRIMDSTKNVLNLAMIINKSKNTAYLYLEPQGGLKNQFPLEIRWTNADNKSSGTTSFYQGDRYSHLRFVQEITSHIIKDDVQFEAKIGEDWFPVLLDGNERLAFKTTSKDYFRLLEN